jgi:hypothetical protein
MPRRPHSSGSWRLPLSTTAAPSDLASSRYVSTAYPGGRRITSRRPFPFSRNPLLGSRHGQIWLRSMRLLRVLISVGWETGGLCVRRRRHYPPGTMRLPANFSKRVLSHLRYRTTAIRKDCSPDITRSSSTARGNDMAAFRPHFTASPPISALTLRRAPRSKTARLPGAGWNSSGSTIRSTHSFCRSRGRGASG